MRNCSGVDRARPAPVVFRPMEQLMPDAMSDVAANTPIRCLMAGVIAAMISGSATLAAETVVPNFAPDSRTGWIAGDRDSVTPVGQDFLPPPSGPGPITF